MSGGAGRVLVGFCEIARDLGRLGMMALVVRTLFLALVLLTSGGTTAPEAGTATLRRRAARARTASTSPRFAGAACSSLACIRWHGRVGANPLARYALLLRRMECAFSIGSRVQRASGSAS